MKKYSVHPNGFFKYSFEDKKELHVWASDIPRQKVPTPIHDHRFGFVSRVLEGTLVNIIYDIMVCTNGLYYLADVVVRGGEDTILVVNSESKYIISSVHHDLYVAGDTYGMEPKIFHESRPHGFVVTEFVKTFQDESYTPRVLVPIGFTPDNTFIR